MYIYIYIYIYMYIYIYIYIYIYVTGFEKRAHLALNTKLRSRAKTANKWYFLQIEFIPSNVLMMCS